MEAESFTCRFGRFELRQDQRLLLVDGQPAKLGSRAFDVLLALVQRRDRTVGKNELLSVVWPTTVVEENNLQVHISALRKLLGSAAIATIPGRGYRFTARLEPTKIVEPAAPQETAGRPASGREPLPFAASPLFGREDDLAALGALLNQHRLITVTGPGGVGKSRLARQLIQLCCDSFADGVAYAELSSLSDPALIGGAIAAALDLETLGVDLSRELVQVLRLRKALIVLDNAEHLIADVARLVQVLIEGTSHLVFVVTSQAPLKVGAERVYRLGSLEVPEMEVAVEEARTYGAVALFEDRAEAADRNFCLSERNIGAVIDICRHLDGLPLAIELAAARVPLLGVSQLSLALEERLRVLGNVDRAAPRRQQTLRAALEWSHGLLGAIEQVVFRRLAVFAGSFPLSLAQQVVTGERCEPPVDEWAFLDALGTLIDRSLVIADSGEIPRYRLLESSRAFALELLATANEEAVFRIRHARVIRSHFERVDADRWDGRVAVDDALAQLEPDLDNAREAMRWTLQHDPPLAVALWAEFCFALTRSRFLDQAREWEVTGRLLTDDVPMLSRGKWHRRFAQFWGNRNRQAATTSIRTALQLHRECGLERQIFLDLHIFCWVNRGHLLEERKAALEEMRRLEQSDWSASMKFRRANAEALVCMDTGAFDEAIAALSRSLRLAEIAHDSQAKRSTLLKLAETELITGRADDALRRCLDLHQKITGTRHRWDLEFAQALIVSAWLAKDDTTRAREAATVGWQLASQTGMSDEWADKLALLAALEGRPRSAARIAGYADANYTAKGASRRLNDVREASRAAELLRAMFGSEEYARLKSEGASFTEADIEAAAFSLADRD